MATPIDEMLCKTLRSLALKAGEATMTIYEAADHDVRSKSDDSPVTAADLAADRIIVAGLAEAFPDVPTVTEERTETHALAAGRTHFLVDPLDGTKEFVQRRGEFTVNIALIEDGAPVAGVVYAPALRRLFITTPDGAAEETAGLDPETPGPLRRLRVAQPDPAALRVVASKSHRDSATDAYIARYAVSDFKSAGSSLKFCLLASGEADLYPRLGRTMEWDTAAGQAVLACAGGKTLRLDDLSPLLYGKLCRDNPYFVACAQTFAPLRLDGPQGSQPQSKAGRRRASGA